MAQLRWSCYLGRDDLKNMSKFDNKWGDVSTFFFKNIDIYSYIGQKKLNTTIIKCDDVIFKKCCSLFKAHADYQQSAGSIFKTNVKCVFLPVRETSEASIPIICPK